jgi:excisionase family DNA binding protein
MERHLTVDETAEFLGTCTRFVRRLVAERKIRFVRVGRLVRIPESAIEQYLRDSTVEPMTISDTWSARRVG